MGRSNLFRFRNIVYLIAVVMSFLHSGVTVNASEKKEVDPTAGAVGFTYKATFPENQIEKDIGYYKLKMKPGQKQTLTITLSNPTTQNIKVLVGVNGAKTNQNGVIEYGDSTIENDKSLKIPFENIVSAPKSIELTGGETKNLEINIQMPETKIEGVVAGGIQLMKDEQNEKTSASEGSKIINQYAYVIGVLLQEDENEALADLKLNNVYANQYNYRNTIFVDFSNIKPGFLNDMTVETKISPKNSKTVLYERKQTAMRMAPNSFIRFPISMNGDKMNAGTYEADILVSSGTKKWRWTKEFQISEKDADRFNERDVELVQENGFNWTLVIVIVFSSLVLISLFYLIFRFVRKNKEEIRKKKLKKKTHKSSKK